jgi:hypothetical protein
MIVGDDPQIDLRIEGSLVLYQWNLAGWKLGIGAKS